MPYEVTIRAETPAELANAISGLFQLPVILAAETQQRIASVAAKVPPAVSEPTESATPAEKVDPPKKPSGRKPKPQTIEAEANPPAEPEVEAELETPADPEPAAAPDRDAVRKALIDYVNDFRTANKAATDEAMQAAVAEVFGTMNPPITPPGMKNVPDERLAELAAVIEAKAAALKETV